MEMKLTHNLVVHCVGRELCTCCVRDLSQSFVFRTMPDFTDVTGAEPNFVYSFTEMNRGEENGIRE